MQEPHPREECHSVHPFALSQAGKRRSSREAKIEFRSWDGETVFKNDLKQ